MRHLSIRRLATEELFLVGPAGRFSADQSESVPLLDLKSYPMILSTPEHGLRQFVELEARKQDFTLDVRLEIDALGRIGSLIANGHGYSILTKPAVAQELAAGRLSIARIGNGALKRTLCLARNPAHVVTHASVRVEDLAAKVLGRMIVKKDWEAQPDDTLPWAGEDTYLPQLERHAPRLSKGDR
jgi:DNA-binding transcriptional LysR family regulator